MDGLHVKASLHCIKQEHALGNLQVARRELSAAKPEVPGLEAYARLHEVGCLHLSPNAYLVSQNQGSPMLTAAAKLVKIEKAVIFQADSFHFLSLSNFTAIFSRFLAPEKRTSLPNGCTHKGMQGEWWSKS